MPEIEVVRRKPRRQRRKRATAAAIMADPVVTVLPREHYDLVPAAVEPEPAPTPDPLPAVLFAVTRKSRPRVDARILGTLTRENIVSGNTHVNWTRREGTVGPVKSREVARRIGILDGGHDPHLSDRPLEPDRQRDATWSPTIKW